MVVRLNDVWAIEGLSASNKSHIVITASSYRGPPSAITFQTGRCGALGMWTAIELMHRLRQTSFILEIHPLQAFAVYSLMLGLIAH